MLIREYTPKDWNELVHLMNSFENYLVKLDNLKRLKPFKDKGKRYTALVLKNIKESKGKIFVAVDRVKIVGFISVILEKQEKSSELEVGKTRYGRIVDLYIDKVYRKKGLGTKLLEEGEKYLRTKKCQVLSVEVFSPNKKAYPFYKRSGYVDRCSELVKIISK